MDFHPTLPMQGFTAVVKRVLCALVTTVAVLRRGCELATLESSLSHSSHALRLSVAL